MIAVDLSLAVGIYLLVAIGVVIAFWFFNESCYRTRNFHKEEKQQWSCSLCLHHYIDSIADHFSRCPRCGNLNKK